MWKDYPDGLNLAVFTNLLIDQVQCSEEEKYELLYGALKLFSEIDINGDKQMEWSEFMQYIIDAVGSSAVPSAEPGTNQESVM